MVFLLASTYFPWEKFQVPCLAAVILGAKQTELQVFFFFFRRQLHLAMCPLPLKTVVCFLGSELGRESLAQRPRKLAVCLVLNWSFQSYLFIYSLLNHHLDTQGRQLFSLWPSHDVFLCWVSVFLIADLVPLLLGPVSLIFHLSAFPESKFVPDPLVFLSLKWRTYIIYTYIYPVDCGSVLCMYCINLFSMVNLDAFRKDDVCGRL